jgi:hypothetical protein
VEKYCRTGRPQITIKHSVCCFACCIDKATADDQNIEYSLLVSANNFYTYRPDIHVIPSLLILGLVRVWEGWRYQIL